MKMLRIIATLLAFCISCSDPVLAMNMIEHRLTVAANAILGLTNQEVDSIISEMNKLISAISYPWDVRCPAVTFKRVGNVINISDDNFPTTGTFDQLQEKLHIFAPSANVMVVSGIDCSGVTAKGCGLIGQEPLIVGQSRGFDAQLWLHERGHNVGLQHSAEAPAAENSVPPYIALRFMFWRLGVGHLGKISSECAAFENTMLASVGKTVSPATATNNGGAPGLQFTTEFIASDSSYSSAASDPATAVVKEARKAGLTEGALKVIALPWVDGAPIQDIKALNQTDLDSIRVIFQGSPNQFWPQAVQTLAIAGAADDVKLINKALNLPMPAVGPESDGASIQQFRILLEIKLTAPKALGILANRTHSSSAVDALIGTADIENARRLVGQASAANLSKNAINGLSIANTTEGNRFINATVGVQLEVKDTGNGGVVPINPEVKVAPLAPKEVEALTKANERVRDFGVESMFK